MTASLAHNIYHDSAIFTYECEQVFRKHWWLIGTESAFANAGDYLALKLMKWPLVILRDQQGELRGFYNLCRHRAGPLVLEGNGRCRDFVCRYHGWRYACSGELLKTPGFEEDGIKDPSTMGLIPIRVASWNGMVFVCLDEAAPDLPSWLGDIIPIAERFDSTATMEFDGDTVKHAATNWKTYGDNSCEGYHVGMVHKALGSSMLRESINIEGYDNGSFVGFDVSYSSGKIKVAPAKGSGFTSFRDYCCISRISPSMPKPSSRSMLLRLSCNAGSGRIRQRPRHRALTRQPSAQIPNRLSMKILPFANWFNVTWSPESTLAVCYPANRNLARFFFSNWFARH